MSTSGSEPVIRRRQVCSRRCRKGLIRFAKDNTSQNGEDGIIQRLFELLPITDTSWCVDVGAWDGVHLSNTNSLLVGTMPSARKWRGVLIEADVQKYKDLLALHQPLHNICLLEEVSGVEGSPRSLSKLLQSMSKTSDGVDMPHDFDFLCIDIDGSDYWVWHDFMKNGVYQPKVVCIEFNPTMPDDLVFIPCRSDKIRQGASVSALVELANRFDYVLVETTLYNAFFVQKDLYHAYLNKEVPDTSIEALHEITMGTSIYQLYDGTVKLWGCKKMLWHRIPMDENKLQMIDVGQRSFPFQPKIQAETFDFSSVVDLSPFTRNEDKDADTNSKKVCVAALLDQLRKDGFCYVKGLGLTQQTCQEALRQTNAFLQEATEDVRRSCLTKDRARRGYCPMNVENFASLVGEKGPNDLVKKFRIGPLHSDKSGSLMQPNIWPSTENWDNAESFRRNMEAFYKELCTAGSKVVNAICEGLVAEFPDLKEALEPLMTRIEDLESNKTSILTLLSYQVTSRHKKVRKSKQMSPLVASHTDVGVITMLVFDNGDCAKLQRSDGNGGWIDVTLPSCVPDDPVIVINMADCFSDLSHGSLPSTLHRVVASDGVQPRNCCALFVGLEAATELRIGGKIMTYEEWRKDRIRKSQNVLRKGQET